MNAIISPETRILADVPAGTLAEVTYVVPEGNSFRLPLIAISPYAGLASLGASDVRANPTPVALDRRSGVRPS